MRSKWKAQIKFSFNLLPAAIFFRFKSLTRRTFCFCLHCIRLKKVTLTPRHSGSASEKFHDKNVKRSMAIATTNDCQCLEDCKMERNVVQPKICGSKWAKVEQCWPVALHSSYKNPRAKCNETATISKNIIQRTYPSSLFCPFSFSCSFQKSNLDWNEREKSVRMLKWQECKICLHVNNTIL